MVSDAGKPQYNNKVSLHVYNHKIIKFELFKKLSYYR